MYSTSVPCEDLECGSLLAEMRNPPAELPKTFVELHPLGFLLRRRRRMRAAHAVALHHAGSHGLHVLLHLLHVADHRFPKIHIIPPSGHLVRVSDRSNVSL